MDTNTESFTDEQLLNMLNRKILNDTEYPIDKYTGGYVSATTAYKNLITKYNICLFFGYKSDKKTSISKVMPIDENTYFVWAKAILVKTNSMRINTIGSTLNEINSLVKPLSKEEEKEIKKRSEEKDRTDTERDTTRNLPPTSTLIPSTSDTSVPREKIKNFIDLKKYVLANNKSSSGTSIQFYFKNKIVCISNKDIPYYKNNGNSPSLSWKDADEFYKYLFDNLDETLELIDYHREQAS